MIISEVPERVRVALAEFPLQLVPDPSGPSGNGQMKVKS
jgi:hypothetical protein